jgi:hypothetical protein
MPKLRIQLATFTRGGVAKTYATRHINASNNSFHTLFELFFPPQNLVDASVE